MASQPLSIATLSVLSLLLLVGLNIYQSYRINTLEATLTQQASTEATSATSNGQLYVPAYSHVYSAEGLPILLEITLSWRNTSPSDSVTIGQVDYFDDQGKLLRRFLKQPIQLGPLQSKEYAIEQTDFSGGMGANFLVAWHSATAGGAPLAEAVMTGGNPEQPISINSRGIAIERPASANMREQE